MNAAQYWKNFDLGIELEISGRFIYNGLRSFFELDSLRYEAEIFEVLYSLAVGLERLLKISVVLIEHDSSSAQADFEATLITHNHLELLRRIRKKHQTPFGTPHNSLLQLLEVFYKSDRYARYGLASHRGNGGETARLHCFIEEHLGVEISGNTPFEISENSDRVKKFLSRIVGKIARFLYQVVVTEADRLNIYTWELRSCSKAARVFLFKDCDFTREDVLWKELLLFFLRSDEPVGQLKHLLSHEPLEFDPGLQSDYLQCFSSEEKKLMVLGELDVLYSDVPDPGGRLKSLGLVGSPQVMFEIDEPEEEEQDEWV